MEHLHIRIQSLEEEVSRLKRENLELKDQLKKLEERLPNANPVKPAGDQGGPKAQAKKSRKAK